MGPSTGGFLVQLNREVLARRVAEPGERVRHRTRFTPPSSERLLLGRRCANRYRKEARPIMVERVIVNLRP
jgi:hypothetical protein